MSGSMERNSNVEFLRFFLMFLICYWHMFVHGYELNLMGSSSSASIANLLQMSLSDYAVDAFMLISGYYSIRFSIDKIIRLSLQAYLVSAVILIIGLFYSSVLITPTYLLQHPFPVSTKIWWFLTEYVIIMILSPFINNGIQSIGKSLFTKLLLLLIFIDCIGYMLIAQGGNHLLNMLVLYLIGRYMSLYIKCPSFYQSIAGFILVTAVLFAILVVLKNYHLEKVGWFLMSNNSIFVILQAIFILWVFLSMPPKTNSFWNSVGKHCFAIYLVTEGIGMSLYRQWAKINDESWLMVIMVIACTCIICIIFDYVQSALNSYLRKHVVNLYHLL